MIDQNSNEPSHDPYIPRSHSVFYNCSSLECEPIVLYSLTQVTSPDLKLTACFRQLGKFECETIRYSHLKNVDKLLFLNKNIGGKKFYGVDCLVYIDRGRVCHRKGDDIKSHAKLVDTGTMARPNESAVLSQDEFICEESEDKQINCDIDPYVPFNDGLKLKESVKIVGDVLLKSGKTTVIMNKKCIGSWCGYSGQDKPTRRSWFERYDPPGGKVYRCYYAKKQQVCKALYHKDKMIYNERGYIST